MTGATGGRWLLPVLAGAAFLVFAQAFMIAPLIPRLAQGVLVQAVVVSILFALLIRPARRARLMQLWAGGVAFTAGLFVLRAVH